ncbi:exonuclease domain-containing protein [Salinibacterium sp. NK8237]|uniref:exonuclease domain-containing protein n=1 Tax=Salinibacterium sp. NK8237 TaxID=2792038 RepID=UPI001E442760|nr:exonuclease domain-containing protein [Salinibacterium sp. NK8237]
MLDFTAIDFETANSFRGSPCSVGLIKVRDGRVVDTQHWLIHPPEGADWFDAWNTAIHGITAEMVADAPRWRETLPGIVNFIGDDVVVAHNAAFDLGVIRYACEVDGIEWPETQFLCSLVMARRALALPSYRLPFVTAALGFELENHHDALSDAMGVVEIIGRLATRQESPDISSLAASVGVRVGHLSTGGYRGCVADHAGDRGFSPIEVNVDADPSGYLYGRVVVFTGALISMTRDAARQECAKAGAIPEQNTTKRTNVLVVGDINVASLRPGSNVTGKARKAFELQDKGQEIEVMTEDDFLRCLDGNRLDGAEVILNASEPRSADGESHTPPSGSIRSRGVGTTERQPLQRPKPVSPPKPLRRNPVPTEQVCSVEGCESTAAFKTRKKPTWCVSHVEEIQLVGGLRPLETFTHPDDWQLTECLTCAVQAHYRFNYTLEKNSWNERTCRACYWRYWAIEARGNSSYLTPTSFSEAESHLDDNGFDYLGPLTAPSLRDDPHLTKCRRCGKISAQRLGDSSFGCTCISKP